ncbi:Lrp/AsnC family transcriptional regulator [Pelagibaculum spongiae]|uniref:Lrp/AsnC family transcriptional regulator n=1 Tax=Pelagibaculum spongiae TaxID=2080658 RepID=UPI0019D46BB6|nr:Lrp/AsnC ligand binding domain-containing protein [Pelagibaculum spongiae]
MSNQIELDRRDRQILNLLQKNSALSNIELAEKVSLSASACLRRVRSLEQQGYLEKYVALVNRQKLLKECTAFVFVTLSHQSAEIFEQFEEAVRELTEVQECHLMTGSSDYLIKLVYQDNAAFEKIFSEKLLRLPGVVGTETRMSMKKVHFTTAIEI